MPFKEPELRTYGTECLSQVPATRGNTKSLCFLNNLSTSEDFDLNKGYVERERESE